MTAKKVSDFIVQRRTEWGVERIVGFSGDGINGILGALGRADNTPELIQPPHEELCALMATGHAKFTRQVGVCLATQGTGAIPSTVGWSPSDRPRPDNSSDDNRVNRPEFRRDSGYWELNRPEYDGDSGVPCVRPARPCLRTDGHLLAVSGYNRGGWGWP